MNQIRVLVIEDSEDLLFLLRTDLESLGYVVEGAQDAPTGLAMTASFRPHVVFSDIGLPGMDGFEFVQRLKQTEVGSVPVVALTGYEADGAGHSFAAKGFAAHLVKPVEPGELSRVIQSVLRDSSSK
jgi:CheY-like chemotaxis protein